MCNKYLTAIGQLGWETVGKPWSVRGWRVLCPLSFRDNLKWGAEGEADGRTESLFTITKAQSQPVQRCARQSDDCCRVADLYDRKRSRQGKEVGRRPSEELVYPLVLFCPWTDFHKHGKAGYNTTGSVPGSSVAWVPTSLWLESAEGYGHLLKINWTTQRGSCHGYTNNWGFLMLQSG